MDHEQDEGTEDEEPKPPAPRSPIDRWVWTALAVLQTGLTLAAIAGGAHIIPLGMFAMLAIVAIRIAVRSWQAPVRTLD